MRIFQQADRIFETDDACGSCERKAERGFLTLTSCQLHQECENQLFRQTTVFFGMKKITGVKEITEDEKIF